MSRSYKKTPFIRQEEEDYHYLNRQIRRDKLAEIPKGSSFKKHRPHWNTWNYVWTWEQAQEDYYSYGQNERYTFKEWRQYWERCAKRK